MPDDLLSFALIILSVMLVARLLIALKLMFIAFIFTLVAYNVLVVDIIVVHWAFLLRIGSGVLDRGEIYISAQDWSILVTVLFWIVQLIVVNGITLVYWRKFDWDRKERD